MEKRSMIASVFTTHAQESLSDFAAIRGPSVCRR